MNLNVGGIQSQILQLLRFYEKKKGINLSLITKYSEFKPLTNMVKIYEIHKFKNFYLDTIYFIFKSFLKIIKIHRKNPISIINIHFYGVIHITSLLIRLLFNIPILMKIPLDFDSYEYAILHSKNKSIFSRYINFCWFKTFKYLFLQKIDYIRAVNNKIYEDLMDFEYPNERILRIPNGIKFKDFIEIPKNFHKEIHFGFVGRLIELKNIRFLLVVFNEYFKLHRTDKLYFYGNGPELKYIKNFIDKNNLNKNISVCGFEKSKKKIYSNIDVLIDPAFAQGISNANLEAMCTNTFLIASNTPGNRDLINHQKTGLLFNPKDYNDLLSQLIYYKENKEKRNEIVRNAKDRIIRDFNIDRIAEKIIKFIIKKLK
ncbi:MAG: glycosyltransferase family 4 protein [Candidatus Hodarchaeota archaeon]